MISNYDEYDQPTTSSVFRVGRDLRNTFGGR